MAAEPDSQTSTIYTLSNISRSKNNQTLRRKIFFFKNHGENEAGRLVPDFFLFFKKALYKVKASRLQLNFNIFR